MYDLLGSISLSLLLGIWVFIDAKKRKHNAAKWTLGTLFLSPFVFPNYFAKRNLKKGEVRTDGTNWYRCKYFALYWTLVMLQVAFFTSMSQLSLTDSIRDDALGLFELTLLWGIPAGGAFILGFLLKRPATIEKGPTGPLAKDKI